MAPPDSRRPGFSRKAQFRIFTGYLAAFIGAFGGLFLLVLSYLDPTVFSAIRTTANEVTAPVSRVLTGARVTGLNSGSEVAAYFQAASKNAAMAREIEANRTQLIEARAYKQENARLKKLLGLVEAEKQPVAVARLISASSSSSRRYAILGAGRNQNIEPGQPVRAQQGLIGRVLSVGRNTSRILLITDADNVVPVKRARDGLVAFAQGRSDGRIDIRLINIGINDLKPGDIMVTSGNGGLYRPNTPVAIIESKTSDGALAYPLSNPAASDFVIVEPVYLPEIVAEEKQLEEDEEARAKASKSTANSDVEQ